MCSEYMLLLLKKANHGCRYVCHAYALFSQQEGTIAKRIRSEPTTFLVAKLSNLHENAYNFHICRVEYCVFYQIHQQRQPITRTKIHVKSLKHSELWWYHSRRKCNSWRHFLTHHTWLCLGAMWGNWWRNEGLIDTPSVWLVSSLPFCTFVYNCNIGVTGLIIYCDRKWIGEMFHPSARCPKETPMARRPAKEEGKGSFTFQRCFCRFFPFPP